MRTDTVQDVSAAFAAEGRRLTPQRRTVLEALRRTHGSITAAQLYEQLHRDQPTLGRATVFRALDALVEAGAAQRFERPGHVYAYAACSPGHHHHLICLRCHATTEVPESTVSALVEELRRAHGFAVEHGSLDFYGTCERCGAARRQ